MERAQNFEPSGERKGNTTALYRSIAIKTTLKIDTALEASAKKGTSLHSISPRRPLTDQKYCPRYSCVKLTGNRKIGYNRSDMTMLAMKSLIGFLKVFEL